MRRFPFIRYCHCLLLLAHAFLCFGAIFNKQQFNIFHYIYYYVVDVYAVRAHGAFYMHFHTVLPWMLSTDVYIPYIKFAVVHCVHNIM